MDVPPDLKDALKEALPGVGGSVTALIFFKRPWPIMIALFVCGVFAARSIGGHVALIMGAEKEVGGFVTGAFAMAIIESIIMSIRKFDGAVALTKVVDAFTTRLGVGRAKGD